MKWDYDSNMTSLFERIKDETKQKPNICLFDYQLDWSESDCKARETSKIIEYNRSVVMRLCLRHTNPFFSSLSKTFDLNYSLYQMIEKHINSEILVCNTIDVKQFCNEYYN